LETVRYSNVEHCTVGVVDLLLVGGILGTDDLELLDEDTEEDGVHDSVEDVDTHHHEHLGVSAGVYLDQHEANGGIVPHCEPLVDEVVPFVPVSIHRL